MPSDTVERLREIDGVLRVRRVAENIFPPTTKRARQRQPQNQVGRENTLKFFKKTAHIAFVSARSNPRITKKDARRRYNADALSSLSNPIGAPRQRQILVVETTRRADKTVIRHTIFRMPERQSLANAFR